MFKPASLLLVSCGVIAAAPCRIEIIDKENGWPVPLVELRGTHETRHVSDNLGLIAIDAPELARTRGVVSCQGPWLRSAKGRLRLRGRPHHAQGRRDLPHQSRAPEHRQTHRPANRRRAFRGGRKTRHRPAAAGNRGFRLRFRPNNPARRQALLAVGRHHVARLSARRLQLHCRHHAARAAEEIRAATGDALHLFPRCERQTSRRCRDPGRRPHMAHRHGLAARQPPRRHLLEDQGLPR